LAEPLTVALSVVRDDMDRWAYVEDVLDQLLKGVTTPRVGRGVRRR
jgi:hypothetical protein